MNGKETYDLIREKVFKLVNNPENFKNENLKVLSEPEETKNLFNESVPVLNPSYKKENRKQFFLNYIKSEEQKHENTKNFFSHLSKCRKMLRFSIQPEFGSNFYDNFSESEEDPIMPTKSGCCESMKNNNYELVN